MRKFKVYSLLPDEGLNGLIRFLHLQDMPFIDDLVYDDINPDYLFAYAPVYTNSDWFRKFRRLIQNENMIRIFCPGECIAPDLNIWDYGIAFDRNLCDMDRISRIPTSIFWLDNDIVFKNNLTQAQAIALLKKKSRFCCFLYTNSLAHCMRDKLFHAISGYKKIESLGRHLNNVNTLICLAGGGARESQDYLRTSIMIKNRYKFSIAAENAQYEGYTSEKLLTSFLAHTVPIYWGNPYAAEEYNPEAFVNCNDYDSFDGIIQRIKQIDEDDNLWAHMASQPWQTAAQEQASHYEYEQYKKFIANIFSQPLHKARRRPKGTWPDFYERRIVNPQEFSPARKFVRRIGKIFHSPQLLVNELRSRKLKTTDINDFFKDGG